MLLQKKSAKSRGAAPTCELAMPRTSANYTGPFSANSLISMCATGKGLPRCILSTLYVVRLCQPTQHFSKIAYKWCKATVQ
jgi:hypothetical protein